MRLAFLFVLAVLLTDVACADEPPGAAGPSAKAASFVMIATVKRSAEAGALDRMDRECVRRMDEAALAPGFQELISSQLTESERKEADAFFSAALAEKYLEDGLRQTQQQTLGTDLAQVEFTAEELETIENFQASEAAKKYFALQASPEWRKVVAPSFARLLLACKKE